jgi:electron transport complex protein RnfB
MIEINHLLREIAGLLHLIDASHFLVPLVGVGGGFEVKEHVELVPLIKYTLLFLSGVGIVFGVGLALTAKKFSVKVDPRIEKVMDVLAHAH